MATNIKGGEYENYVNNIYERQSEYGIVQPLYSFVRENGYSIYDMQDILEKEVPTEKDAWGDKKYSKKSIRKMIGVISGKYAKGTTVKGGGKAVADSKTKIEIKIDEEGRKIAKRTLVKANSKGEKVTYELTVGLHEGRKRGWFELYATDEEGEEYFYSEGGLWIEGGKITDYDGVYELSEKLKPLMSALNLNSVDVYEEGGSILANGSTVKGKKTAEEIYEEEQHNAMFNSEYGNGGVIPYALRKRVENVKNKFGIEITKEMSLQAYHWNTEEGMGGSSVGLKLYKAKNKRDSQTIGDTAINLGRFYSQNQYANGGNTTNVFNYSIGGL